MKNIENLRTSLKGKNTIIKGKGSVLMKIPSKSRFSCVHLFKNQRFVTTRLFRRRKRANGSRKRANGSWKQQPAPENELPKTSGNKKKLPAAINAAGSLRKFVR